jgi:hypothetical protein
MSAHSETGRSFSAVAPLVEGGDRDPEVFGKLLHGEEPVPVFHAFDHQRNPVISMPRFEMSQIGGFSTLC